jgi:hypothetical protein
MSGVLQPRMQTRITISNVTTDENSDPKPLAGTEDDVAKGLKPAENDGRGSSGVNEVAEGTPWFRRPRNLLASGLIVLAGVSAFVFAESRESQTSSSQITSVQGDGGASRTLKDYVGENQITQTPVLRDEQGSPAIDLPLPWGWKDAGVDSPEGVYRELVFKWPANASDPPTIMLLLSKMTGNVEPGKILQYSTGELRNLPEYTELSVPVESTQSGFDAVQLGGIYRMDGQERFIAQKTIVIPSQDGLYVLQMNVDVPSRDGPGILSRATADIDEQLKIIP